MNSRGDPISQAGVGGDVARYAPALQALHWTLTVLIAVQLALIPILRQLESAEFAQIVLSLHRSCGTLVWLLIIVRLLVGLRTPTPSPPDAGPVWRPWASKAVQTALLVALFIQPILGVMSAWARGDDVMVAGLFKLPQLLAFTTEQGGTLKVLHRWTAYSLLCLISAHLGGLLLRRMIYKAPVLEPMLPAPPTNRITNRAPFTVQLALYCGVVLTLNTAAVFYAADQYKTLTDRQELFDQSEVATLDELRTTQVELKSLVPLLVSASRADAFGEAAKRIAAEVDGLRENTGSAGARAALAEAGAGLRDLAGGARSLARFEAVDKRFGEAVASQDALVRQDRLQMRAFGAKGHDLIILMLAPAVIVSAALAFLLSRSMLSALWRARALVQSVGAGTAAEEFQVRGSGEFAQLIRDVLRVRHTVELRQREADARAAEHRSAIEREQSERRLQELQNELLHMSRLTVLGEMSSALAHELNQPLSAIANYLSGAQHLIASHPSAVSGRVSEGVNKAMKQALGAGEIIRRLRAFAVRKETEQKVESLAILVEEASALGLIGVRRFGVTVTLDLDPTADLVLVDRVRIQQVLLNLIRNAVEAMTESERRELTLSSAPAAHQMLEIRVADTGPGLAAEVAARLFQPFVTTKADGMGVGLSICRTIVEAQGGEIWTTANPGGGTVFHVTVPRAGGAGIVDAAGGHSPAG